MYDDIRPYNDAETVAALKRASRNRLMDQISAFLFPGKDPDILRNTLNTVQGVEDFQTRVMVPAVGSILSKTTHGLSYEGTRFFTGNRCYTMVSSHRDIVLDSAFIQYIFENHNLPLSEIAVGDNLLYSRFVEDLMRSNRMIKVIRGIGARQLYLSSLRLSRYIRESITSGRASIWIAQREGRTKNGCDTTEQGLLKMFDLSGEGCFEENFRALNIVPMSISYEYESCDSRKAREVLLRREGPYTKKPKEDLHSILTGIRQQKGHIHLEIGEPLSAEEIAEASKCEKNDRYQAIRHALDLRIIDGYKLWQTNYMAHDLLYGKHEFADAGMYRAEDLHAFEDYIDHKLGKLERRLDRSELTKIFLGIYAGPIDAKKLHNLYYVK